MKSLFKKTFWVMVFAISSCAFAEILPENPKAESIVPLLPDNQKKLKDFVSQEERKTALDEDLKG